MLLFMNYFCFVTDVSNCTSNTYTCQCHHLPRVCFVSGVGYAVVLIASYVDLFYNVILAWSLRYFFSSFTSKLPWTNCNNTWNTEHCVEVSSSRSFGETQNIVWRLVT